MVEKSEVHGMGKAKQAQRDFGEGREGDRLEGPGGPILKKYREAWRTQLAVSIGTLRLIKEWGTV